MKNRILRSVVLLSVVLCVTMLFTACTKSTEQGVKYKIVEENGEYHVEITSLSESSTTSDITIPDELDGYPVTKINNFSLFNTESLQIIRIGKNVREIGDWSLTNNKSMKEFVVDPENEWFTAVDGVLFTKDMKTLVCYPTAKNITLDRFGLTKDTTTYTVPEGVENIRNRAFYRCGYLTEVFLPTSLKTIGEMAFHTCSALQKIVLPEGLESIGKDAFAYCTGLTEITIPSTTKVVSEYAFSYSENIKKVVLKCKQGEVDLQGKWYPTLDGRDMKDLQIIWEE